MYNVPTHLLKKRFSNEIKKNDLLMIHHNNKTYRCHRIIIINVV